MARLAPSVTASIAHAPSERLPVQNQPAMMKNFFKICKFSLFCLVLRYAVSGKITLRDFYAAQILAQIWPALSNLKCEAACLFTASKRPKFTQI